jgi:hypothetical protein
MAVGLPSRMCALLSVLLEDQDRETGMFQSRAEFGLFERQTVDFVIRYDKH